MLREDTTIFVLLEEKKRGEGEKSHIKKCCLPAVLVQDGNKWENKMRWDGACWGGGGERGHGRKGGEFGGKEGVREEEG